MQRTSFSTLRRKVEDDKGKDFRLFTGGPFTSL